MTATIPNIERVHIDDVSPYWRNPRRIPTEAVEAVKSSLAAYGYVQPIVIDADKVIIIGHTRYTALRKLDVQEIDVVVADHLTPLAAKKLRVIDNRSSEYTTWDFEVLMEELSVLSSDISEEDGRLMSALFPEINAATDTESAAEATERADESWRYVVPEVEFVCPTCFHEWEATVTREQVMAQRIEPTNTEAKK